MENLYDTDYHLWLSQQRDLLAKRQFDQLDIENLLGELELGLNDHIRELRNLLTNLILHLLKCEYQTTVLKDGCNMYFIHSWLTSIDNSRSEIESLIEENSCVRSKVDETLVEAYPKAKQRAIRGMNSYARSEAQRLNSSSFPDGCPWSFDQIMTEDWYPLNGVNIQIHD